MGDELKKVEFLDSSTTYISEIVKIKNSSQKPDIKLELLTILIKDYFRKRYHASKNMGFSEMIEFFLERKKPSVATFCHEMVIDLYSGEEIDERKINYILENTKLVITKDLSNKNELDDKISVREVINPFSVIKDIPIEKERILSKNARKIIEKYLKEQENEPLKDNKLEEKLAVKVKEDNLEYLKRKLSLNQNEVTEASIYLKGDNPEKIERIDNFERLKDKIKRRKI